MQDVCIYARDNNYLYFTSVLNKHKHNYIIIYEEKTGCARRQFIMYERLVVGQVPPRRIRLKYYFIKFFMDV